MRRRGYLAGVAAGIGALLASAAGSASAVADRLAGRRRLLGARARSPRIVSGSTDPGPNETVGTDDSVEVTVRAYDPAGRLDRIVWVEGRNYTTVDETDVSGTRAAGTLRFAETPHWIDYGYPTMAKVVTRDGRESGLARVDGPAVRQPLEVTIAGTNDPVAAGDVLEVTAEVVNVGDLQMVGPDAQEIELIAGGNVLDRETVSVPWNETETTTLSFETYPVRRDVEFPVTVAGEDDRDERTVEVFAGGESTLAVTSVDAGDPVTGGEYLPVTATVENRGGSATTQTVSLIVAGDEFDAESVSVGPGESATVSLGFETYPVRQDVEFPVTIRTEDGSAAQTVEVFAVD